MVKKVSLCDFPPEGVQACVCLCVPCVCVPVCVCGHVGVHMEHFVSRSVRVNMPAGERTGESRCLNVPCGQALGGVNTRPTGQGAAQLETKPPRVWLKRT